MKEVAEGKERCKGERRNLRVYPRHSLLLKSNLQQPDYMNR